MIHLLNFIASAITFHSFCQLKYVDVEVSVGRAALWTLQKIANSKTIETIHDHPLASFNSPDTLSTHQVPEGHLVTLH